MPDISDRARSISAYAAEVRAFHVFFGTVLILTAAVHLFVLLPYIELRWTAPALDAAMVAGTAAATDAAESGRAAQSAREALERLRAAVEAAPAELYRAIAALAPGERNAADKRDAIDDAIRRQIGQQTDALSGAVDAVLEPLRAVRNPSPEVAEAAQLVEAEVGRRVLALNQILLEALAADAAFWVRLARSDATFAAASPRGEEWAQGIWGALRVAEARLAAAISAAKGREGAARRRVALLGERRRELQERMTALDARLSWFPTGLEGWLRLYPLVAGGLALTALFRLRRLLNLRRSLGGIDLDVMAPSWVVVPPGAPGRLWAVLLVSLPVAAAIHASLVALEDRGAFAGILVEPDPLRTATYGVLYGVLSLVGLWQLVLAGRTMLAPRPVAVSEKTPQNR
ncbi:MAG: hypothetical protein QN183_15690 [Armatimonadota bacterium]|nr:hypothetical protein [Armatimonadota bacterium]MDR7544015.1 hypothetical protein [Armatimonadota bacterium]